MKVVLECTPYTSDKIHWKCKTLLLQIQPIIQDYVGYCCSLRTKGSVLWYIKWILVLQSVNQANNTDCHLWLGHCCCCLRTKIQFLAKPKASQLCFGYHCLGTEIRCSWPTKRHPSWALDTTTARGRKSSVLGRPKGIPVGLWILLLPGDGNQVFLADHKASRLCFGYCYCLGTKIKCSWLTIEKKAE